MSTTAEGLAQEARAALARLEGSVATGINAEPARYAEEKALGIAQAKALLAMYETMNDTMREVTAAIDQFRTDWLAEQAKGKKK